MYSVANDTKFYPAKKMHITSHIQCGFLHGDHETAVLPVLSVMLDYVFLLLDERAYYLRSKLSVSLGKV